MGVQMEWFTIRHTGGLELNECDHQDFHGLGNLTQNRQLQPLK